MKRERPRHEGSPSRPPGHDESWFGGLGSAPDAADTQAMNDDSRFAVSWQSEAEARAGRRRPDDADTTTFGRIYGAFISARAALGVALVVTVVLSGAFGVRPGFAVAALSIGYATLAISMWLLPRFRRGETRRLLLHLRRSQWLASVGVDLVFFTGLHIVSPGSSFNYVALLVMPVLTAGVLTPRLPALATAAMATLALLATAWLNVIGGGDATLLMTQAGLAGSGFFVISVLAGELAGRLAREQLSAQGSFEMARQQAQLNRLVIEEMADGVLVVDRGGKVRAANPAARRLLAPEGMSRQAPFQLRGVPAWGPLVQAVERAFAEASWPEAGRDVPLPFAPDVSRTVRLRVRFTRKREPAASEEYCVLFLEDVRTVQARSRQEKLAAMGRVSAGIAHEIRNPLAAISQANALMAEDATEPGQRQLTRMVSDNVARLKRIVDDVLDVTPAQQAQEAGVIDLNAELAALCGEWAQAIALPGSGAGLLQVELPTTPLGAVFDPEHLRRVVVNLLDNARRHSSDQPGAIRLRIDEDEAGAERVVFSVASDGPPIAEDVEPYLFEPFFSTRSRGAGLGLYICRELCERYGARIDYRPLPAGEPHRNEFFVDMRRGVLLPSEASLDLTS